MKKTNRNEAIILFNKTRKAKLIEENNRAFHLARSGRVPKSLKDGTYRRINQRNKLRSFLYSQIRQKPDDLYVEDIGCTVGELKRHIESQFTEGMTWETWGARGWHIDHIRPLALFDLSKINECRKASHYTNLQPIWWRDNISKGKKYDSPVE